MKTKHFLSLALIAGILTACGGGTTDGETTTETTEHAHAHEHGTEAESHEATGTEVMLNDGQPWEANPETTEGIENMKEIILNFHQEPGDKDYENLKEKLDYEFQTIFAKCTMTGEAHNQLHNFLHPMRGLIDDLTAEGGDAARSLEALYGELEKYPNYFYTPA